MVGQILVWIQTFGPLKIPYLKANMWISYTLSIPITFLFIQATKIGFQGFGESWPIRFLGFTIGMITFTLLTNIVMNEPFNTKTVISMLLAIAIIAIQIFWD